MQWPRLEGRTLQRLIPRYAPTARARIARRYHGGAQRCGRPGPQHIQGGIISFRRRKTTIPVHCPMLPEFPRGNRGHAKSETLGFLVTERGEPFTVAGFGNWFRDRLRRRGNRRF